MFSPSLLSPLLTLLSLIPAISAGATICNGHPEYCSRIYSNVTQVASHDSAFVGFLPTQNQHKSVADQLTFGIRFLEAQSHVKNNALELCHTSCIEEDSGLAVDYLKTVKSFLDGNVNEVVTVLLTNGDRVDPAMFDSILTAAGLQDYLFVPSSDGSVIPIGNWPTLGEMIDSGKRLVFILDYGADMKRFPGIIDEFSYFWETPFDETDRNFSNCNVNRGAPIDGKMCIVNHFLDVSIFGIDVPDVLEAGRTNAVSGEGSIGAQVALCQSLHGGQLPKAVFLDYVDMGQPLQAEKMLNGIS